MCFIKDNTRNVFFLHRQSIDLILFELGEQYKSFELGLCYHAPGFPRLIPCTVASGFRRADSTCGCAGSSVSFELYGRVTSVTGIGLVWNKNSVSELFMTFHDSNQCFCWHGVQNNRQTARNVPPSVLCDLQVKRAHCIKIWSF